MIPSGIGQLVPFGSALDRCGFSVAFFDEDEAARCLGAEAAADTAARGDSAAEALADAREAAPAAAPLVDFDLLRLDIVGGVGEERSDERAGSSRGDESRVSGRGGQWPASRTTTRTDERVRGGEHGRVCWWVPVQPPSP